MRLSLVIGSVFFVACGGAPQGVVRGPAATVVSQAAANYQAAGHQCKINNALAVCDMGVPNRDLVVIGYNETSGQLGFASFAPTQLFGKDCATLAPAIVATPHPPWMGVKCEFADDEKKVPAVVITGTTGMPDNGLSRAEFNQVVVQFLLEAKAYVVRLAAQSNANGGKTPPPTTAGSTNL
jgi:hypothetical protein